MIYYLFFFFIIFFIWKYYFSYVCVFCRGISYVINKYCINYNIFELILTNKWYKTINIGIQ